VKKGKLVVPPAVPDSTSVESEPATEKQNGRATRRQFLSGTGMTVGVLGSGMLAPQSLVAQTIASVHHDDDDPNRLVAAEGRKRAEQSFDVRTLAARREHQQSLPDQYNNGDERRFLNRIGNYSKGLPHNAIGEVNPQAYGQFLTALESGKFSDLENIPLGGALKLQNPIAAFTFDLEGADSHRLPIRVPPTVSSAETAGEMVELYWQALTRDVPFVNFDTDPITQAAAADLSKLSDFRGPKVNGQVTTGTLFRADLPGVTTGPHISQFLLNTIPYGANSIPPQIRTVLPGIDYLTSFSDWLNIQNGALPVAPNQFDPTPQLIRTPRDIGEYVHRDFEFQAALNAFLLLQSLRAPASPTNPYNLSKTQMPAITFGAVFTPDMLDRAVNCGTRAAWYQKWAVHRRLRPEEMGGLIQNHKTGVARAPLSNEILNAAVLNLVASRFGSFLLPMAFPEGCPSHPSYPAGHAVIIGASVTILKALFDEAFVIPKPVMPSPDGKSLVPFIGTPLTVGGELNKLASNIALARNGAGVHWRSDSVEGINLGEKAAISLLQDMKLTLTEPFEGFSFTKFDGTSIVI